jgi:hypothetical protein
MKQISCYGRTDCSHGQRNDRSVQVKIHEKEKDNLVITTIDMANGINLPFSFSARENLIVSINIGLAAPGSLVGY